jgi:mutator protein MutT
MIPCVGAVVIDDDGRILLVRRANPPAQGMWSIPGGRVEPGESDEQAVVRELREETGLMGVAGREVGTVLREAPSGGTYVIRDFVVAVGQPASVVAGDDASDARWVAMDELQSMATSPGLIDALLEWGIVGPEA